MDGKNSLVNEAITKWFTIKKKGVEREIEFSVVVEFFRFIFYTWFVIIVITGIALTYGVTIKTNETFYETIEGVFGSVNICAFFDFPPSTYFLPAMYAIQLLIIYQYSFLSVFRAWIARLENKISNLAFLSYSGTFLYFCLSAALFSTIFAVQPNPKEPNTVIIHTLPFTNLIIALTSLQIAVTWFGRNVSWKGLKHSNKLTKRLCRAFTYTCLALLILTSLFKVVHQINALADIIHEDHNHLNNTTELPTEKKYKPHGLWFDVHAHKALLQLVDKLWLLAALVGPMLQSGYLTFKTFHTHLIIFKVRDNRRANPRESEVQNRVNEEELRAFSDTENGIV